MIENKITFVRQKAGESNVYTLGTIGPHHVVSTKLPLIGRSRTAQISTGSTTTRLLGTFQHVQHVFIIGCAGGVPHYTDASKHVRRGDIVVAYPNEEDYIYGKYTLIYIRKTIKRVYVLTNERVFYLHIVVGNTLSICVKVYVNIRCNDDISDE